MTVTTCPCCGRERYVSRIRRPPPIEDVSLFCLTTGDEACQDITNKRVAELVQPIHWEDVEDEWTADIKAAHPSRSGSHDEYAIAMRMVGNRHSKGELVALVNWLLLRAQR